MDNNNNHTDFSNDDTLEDLLRTRTLPASSASLRQCVLAAAEEQAAKRAHHTTLRKYHRHPAVMIPLTMAASVLLVLGVWAYLGQNENPTTPVPVLQISKQPQTVTVTLAEVDSSLGALRQRLDTMNSVGSPLRSRTSTRSTHLLERVQTIRKQLESENG